MPLVLKPNDATTDDYRVMHDEAVAALKESWSKWLASAELSETGEPS